MSDGFSVDLVPALIPRSIVLPAEYSEATIEVELVVGVDGRVCCPGLDEVKAALAVGSVELVRSYCEMWTRWLARARKAVSA